MSLVALRFILTRVVPRLPLLTRLSIAHSLGLLETSPLWDLKTTLIIRFLRSLLADGEAVPISKQQKFSTRDPGIKGPLWVAKVDVPKLEDNDTVLKTLLEAVDARKEKGAKYDIPQSEAFYAEWTGYRPGAKENTPHAKDLSEAQTYQKLMEDTKSDATILYFHGGALYLADVATHRPVCSNLARISGGRCLNIRYRLAPKYAFPAAILDCLTAYLYLLYPPPGSLHEPVPASKIVFAGDSAGGTLSTALLQVLLQFHRMAPAGQPPKVQYMGREVEIPLPAGIACSSAWVDLTRTMPSMITNHKYDYLPIPHKGSLHEHFPPCEIWPAAERREDLYCDGTFLMHPFVSTLATSSEDWKGSPPVFMFYGEEMLLDEGKYLVRKMVQAGVHVQWEEFQGMPHVFAAMLKDLPQSKMAMNMWGDFIARVTKGEEIETRGTYYCAKDWTGTTIEISTFGDLSDKEICDRMTEEVNVREGYINAGLSANAKTKPKL